MKRIAFIISGCVVLFFTACTKKDSGSSVSDNVLNYEIKEVPVTGDYVVGSWYYNVANFNANITEVPVVGKYSMPNGVVPPAVMSKHIEFAGKAGIDYFLFQFRSANRDANNYKSDSTVVKSFLDANAANMKFALAYNFNSSSYAISTTAPLEKDAAKLEQFYQDILRVAALLSNANYMKVNSKALLYIMNAQTLFSNDNPTIYKTLRNRVAALGVQLYLVGMQDRWTPPARYPFRYQNSVDAIYHQSYSSQLNNWDRWWLLPQTMDQNWKYSKQWFADNIAVDYVPNITPAYNWKITQPTSVNPNYPRTDNGEMYRKLCNVAKMNASSTTRLILVDSWNKWDEDMQLEPANSYGELYLNITREEFKKPK
jgi:hypothetical protein